MAAVVFFHAELTWASGGFLGVSTFFTLSGFLITSLLLAERSATDGIDLRAFWVRRARRLLPASLAGIALALAYGLLVADAAVREELAGDVIACLAYVANWWFLASGQSYAELFSAPSPLLHYWSLAIEEQFYLVFPLLVWALVARRATSRRGLALVLGVLAAGSVALSLSGLLSDDQIYYGTLTRAAELLLGALLAVALTSRRRTARLADDLKLQTLVGVLGVGALAGMTLLWATASEGDAWLYRGGFAVYAIGSCAVILAALVPGGPIEALLGVRPLRYLGSRSYGIYVYHWPLFLWLDERRTGLDGPGLLAIRLAVTLAVAEASYRLLEQPIRQGRSLLPARAGWTDQVRGARLALPAMVVLAVAGVLISSTAPPPVVDFASAEERAAVLDGATLPDADPAAAPSNGIVPAPDLDVVAVDPPRPRLAMFGDSTALLTSGGLGTWAKETGALDVVPGISRLGCGIGRGGYRWRDDGTVEPVPPHCDDWANTWGEKVKVFSPNLVVVQVGPWETMDRRFTDDDRWHRLGEPAFDEWMLTELTEAVDTLSKEGAVVLWLTSPPMNDNLDRQGDFGLESTSDPARMDRLNQLVRQLPALRPGVVGVVDLAGWLAASGRDATLRPDGVHFDDPGALDVARAWLGPELVAAYEQLWRDGAADRAARVRAEMSYPEVTPRSNDTPLRIVVWGDVTAAEVGAGLGRWGADGRTIDVTTVSRADCGPTRPDKRKVGSEAVGVPPACAARTELWAAVESVDPDVVLVVTGRWEIADQLIGGEPMVWVAPNSGVYDDWARAEIGQLSDELHRSVPVVLWTTVPEYRVADDDPAEEPGRSRRVSQLVVDMVGAAPRRGWADAIDLAERLRTQSAGPFDVAQRPDGVTFSPTGADDLATWLGPEVVARYDSRAAGAPRSTSK